jgi:hypothetical protein
MNNSRTTQLVFFVSFLFLMRFSRVHAWGHTGHYILGEATFKTLAPSSQRLLAPLLLNNSMGQTSVWADRVKFQQKYAFTRTWHYFDSNLSDPPLYCKLDMEPHPTPNLLTALHNMTTQFERHNTYNTLPKVQDQVVFSTMDNMYPETDSQQFATYMLIHMLQDLTQPLHLTHTRKAGLQEPIKNQRGAMTNLHSYVDVDVVDQVVALHGSGSVSKTIDVLVLEANRRKRGTGRCTIIDLYVWAQEIERYNCDILWRKPFDQAYHMAATSMGFELLTKGVTLGACFWENLLQQ